MQPYQHEVEEAMKKYYATLSEKDQRRYAAVEALKLDRGGQSYIARLLGYCERTVSRGLEDLAGLPEQPKHEALQRKPGGGRNRYDESHPNIDDVFQEVLKEHTAGDPMDEQVVWTDLTPREIGEMLERDHQVRVSKSVVIKLLKKHRYRRRKAQKKETLKSVEHRDEQFGKIAGLKAEFRAAGNPIISFDTKKKEYLGNLYREGHLYTQKEQRTYDHDFTSYAAGIIIPHGIYDLQRNVGYLHLGTSKDTSEFACDCIRSWWKQYGREAYPHVTCACQGVIFTSVALVKELMKKTHTSKGLQVVVEIIDTVYQTGRKVADDFMSSMRIIFDTVLPLWNCRVRPFLTLN